MCRCGVQVVGGNFWARTQKSGGLGEGWEEFRRIFLSLCSRSSHLESGTLFPLSLLLAVFVPGVWVLLMSTKIGFFGRRLSSWEQCLVLQWIHALRQYFGYGRISHIFYVAADSNPEAFLLHSV